MMFLFLLSPVTASPIFCPVDFSSWGWTAEVMLKRSAKKPKKNSGRNVRLLRVGLGCGSSLVGEGLSALFG
jgi:hypothetical protein